MDVNAIATRLAEWGIRLDHVTLQCSRVGEQHCVRVTPEFLQYAIRSDDWIAEYIEDKFYERITKGT